MDAGIHPLDRHMQLAGRALTVACAAGDNLTIHKAVMLAQPGDVLVINCGGYLNAGVFGEMLALSCMAKGIAGVVIDGSCRDVNDLVELGFPTFVRGVNPRGTIKDTCGAVGGEVLCGGVTVRAGDIVVGDCDGVVVIPREEADVILDKALAKKQREDEMRPLLRAGGTTAELLGLMDKLGLS
ncbi:MAG: RraA family protein [Ruminococcaceae bacterium]|nr:RraA family protein [Oscillospiraceae bacterium]